jgi:hypothetical protein
MGHADPHTQELHPQVGRGVDQQISLGQASDRRTAEPLVSRVRAQANAAAAPDRRDTDAGSCAEQDELATDVTRVNRLRHGSLVSS